MKNEKRKNKVKNSIVLTLLIFTFSFFFCLSCDNISDQPEINTPIGYGRININFAGEEASQTARTVLPSTVFDKYVYTFTKLSPATTGGETTGVELNPDNEGFFSLEIGSYTVEVQAFTGNAEPYTRAAIGVSSEFSVGSGVNDPVVVFLSKVDTEGQGEFIYTITYPAGAEAEITLQKWPGLDDITLHPVNQGNGKTQTLQLETGSYLLTILINKNGLYAGKNEAIHIYPSLVTVYTKNYADNDLLAATPITNAEIIITAPVKGAIPSTTATMADDGTGNFTMGTVSWEPENNPFQGGIVYTATITLTADNRCTFTGLLSATINGQSATISHNTGAAVTLSHIFPATDTRTVTNIAIKTQPTKLTYTHGDPLDLTGLVVTLTHDDASTEDVAAADFTAKNITTNPVHGNHLIRSTHNGQPVTIIYGGLTPLNTSNVTVNPKVITFVVDSIPSQTYTGSAHTPPIMVLDNTTTLTLTTDYTAAYTNNTNAGTATVTITGVGNYAGSSGSRTFTINPKVITFAVDTIPAQTYTGSAHTPMVTVRDGTTTLTSTADYTAAYTDNTNAGTATVTITGADNYAGSSGSRTFTINKAAGVTVNAPTLNARTHNSITINPVTASTEQAVEYARNTTNAAPSTEWQTGTTLSGLNAGTTYYIFARTAGNNNYETGAASDSLTVTTLQAVSPDRIEYYWVNEHGSLVTTSGGETTIAAGATLTITAQGDDYVVQQWHLNGINTGQSGNTYNFSSTTTGRHTVGLFVKKDGKLYNSNITITVTRTVTINMYDSYGDGWDDNGALRINKNGAQLATNVKVNSGYSNTYTFTVSTGDIVQLYWVAGSSQHENSFIVYYTDTPPVPTFTTSNNNNWNGSNALIYKLRTTIGTTGSNYLTNVADGTLLGSFTVQ